MSKRIKIHFIGIGGIGVSALAQYYLAKGFKVSGSDLVSSEITEFLDKKGAKIFIGNHNTKNLPENTNLVIYSPAVKKDNPELKRAKQLRIKCLSYPQALGGLTKRYFTIAVSGTHGKSTTAAMISLILIRAGLDPTVIVGTKVKEFRNSNCRVGKSKYLVIEADEYMASFLNYWPKIVVLTSLEPDHLDYYKNFKNYKNAFKKFISHLSKNGVLIINLDDKNIKKLYPVFSTAVKKVKRYSLKERKIVEKIRMVLRIPGEFNVSNALAALEVGRVLKIPDKTSFEALSRYQGSWRRFEVLKTKLPWLKRKVTIISDYAHHPTEVRATLRAAREKFPKKEIWCIFQPHQYQRTYYLFKDFVEVLKKAPVDKLIISDIYTVAGRERKEVMRKVSSEKLVEAIKKENAIYIPSFQEIKKYLKENLKGGEVIIIMGAGDIYLLEKELIS